MPREQAASLSSEPDISSQRLDRRVRVLGANLRDRSCSVSELRSKPFVVLVGEPGMGKSKVLLEEAEAAGTKPVTVRDILDGFEHRKGTLFLDALDEYRSDGGERDKVVGLAKHLIAAETQCWRLTCRAEDWREASDLGLLRKTTGGKDITVAQLLPLDWTEAVTVLANLGAEYPEKFVSRAFAMGAGSFTTSPLSLKLLHAAVRSEGDWPRTRYDLFHRAVERLAKEQDNERGAAQRNRPPASVVVEAAGRVCATQLLSGAVRISRRERPGSSGEESRREIVADLFAFEPPLVRHVLGSALFRGDGRTFEPCHKTVAEFVGAKSLADRVTADNDALPFGRALALMTSADGRAPTELRGLYAWFAIHLSKRDRPDLAGALIDRDPVSVLQYGDVASLPAPLCRELLRLLGQDDPFFVDYWSSDTGTSGLARSDMEEDLRTVLQDPNETIHRKSVVFDALANGRPVDGLIPDLREMVLNEGLQSGDRSRALSAWLNAVSQDSDRRGSLYDDLSLQEPSLAREILRVQLFAALPSNSVDADCLRSLLSDYERSEKERVIGRLWKVRQRLDVEPMPELFDLPTSTWRADPTKGKFDSEVESLLESALIAAIAAEPDLSAERLLTWLENLSKLDYRHWSNPIQEAVRLWMAGAPEREEALFFAALDRSTDEASEAAWKATSTFIEATDRMPTEVVLESALRRLRGANDLTERKRLVAVLRDVGRRGTLAPDLFDRVHDAIVANGTDEDVRYLTVCKIDRFRRKEAERKAKQRRKALAAREKNRREIRSQIDVVRRGEHAGASSWAASHVRTAMGTGGKVSETAFSRLSERSDDKAAAAALEGLLHASDSLPDWLTVGWMAEAGNSHSNWEGVLVTSVERRLAAGVLPEVDDLPPLLPLVVLRSIFILNDNDRREVVRQWAWSTFGAAPAAGKDRLLQFWNACLDYGADHLPCVPYQSDSLGEGKEVFVAAASTILERPDLPRRALEELLRTLLSCLSRERMIELATRANERLMDGSEAKHVWSAVRLGCDPSRSEAPSGDLDEVISEYGEARAFAWEAAKTYGKERELRRVVVETIGPLVTPEQHVHDEERETQGPASAGAKLVKNAIDAFSSDPTGLSTEVLINFAASDDLRSWTPYLTNAIAQQRAIRRDVTFVHPTAQEVVRTMEGKAPANASDLHAVLVEELRRFQREIRASDTTPRTVFWNQDQYGRSTQPKIENACRDALLTIIGPRLERYRVSAITPEGQEAEGRRADAILFGASGRAVPVEAKRHYHGDLWTAAQTQLQDYAADPRSGGFGVYVVFWFGTDVSSVPTPPSEMVRPESSIELESALVAQLNSNERPRTEIIVLDVSRNGPSTRIGSTRTSDLVEDGSAI